MFRLDRRRWVGLAALVGLLAYIGWMAGPYLRSVILRDAAITSWINHTASPIAGYVGLHPLYPGERVGADGLIAAIEDPLADRSALTRVEADLERAIQRRKSLEQAIALRQSTADARATVAQTYAETFKQDLETRIKAASGSLSLTTQSLGLQKTLTSLQSELDRSTQRRSAAEQGTFLLEDGTDAAVASRALDDTRLALNQAKLDLTLAEVDVGLARQMLAAAQQAYDKARRAPVAAPPGALVWSLATAPGTAVQPGSPVASWVDCAVMMVDAPVSDVELALLPKGTQA